jgi:hypothetical protein
MWTERSWLILKQYFNICLKELTTNRFKIWISGLIFETRGLTTWTEVRQRGGEGTENKRQKMRKELKKTKLTALKPPL